MLGAEPVTLTDEQLRACCAADAWLARMRAVQPAPLKELLDLSDDVVLALDEPSLDQALAAHARIGERRLGSTTEDRWSRTEQAGALAADDQVQQRIAEGNRRYEEKFGRVFLIRAAGRTAEEMADAVEQRLGNDLRTEGDVVRRELAEIVRLRLERAAGTGP
jgi:2-oxo-4-hydroxy-4-carboxy-5-ureidoimidazoline decarboxylase